MKKLLFGLVASIMLSVNGNAQSSERVKLFCYTTSCCSFYFFDVEIVSTKHCYYASVQNAKIASNEKVTIKLEGRNIENIKEVEVLDDVILTYLKDSYDNPLVLQKGKYSINTNSELSFTPVTSKVRIKKACITEHVTGHILGHDVDYSMTICAYYVDWFAKKGSLSITPKLSVEQKNEIIKNNNILTLKEDYIINFTEGKYNLKAGDYFLNEDGTIHIINSILD